MKIAMIQRFLPSESRGGVGYYVHRLSNRLVEKGHTVVVYSSSPKPDGAIYDVVNPEGINRRFFKLKYTSIFTFAFWIARQKFNSFDIIHAHGDNFLLYRRNPPVIRTFHGTSLLEARFSDNLKVMFYYLVIGYFTEIIAALLSHLNVGVSNCTRRYIPFIKRIIYSGYDEKIFMLGNEKQDNPVIMFVGYLKGRKRGNFLKKLFEEKIVSSIKDAELWMVCGVDDQKDNIKMWSYLSEQQLAELYRKAWILCHTSQYEGFGLPYIEAMACGTPIVTTDKYGAKEVIGNGGLIVDEEEMPSTIIRLLNDKNLLMKFSRNAIERAKEFTLEKCVEEYISVYKEVIWSNRGYKG